MLYPNFLLKSSYKLPLFILLLISTTFGIICFFGDYHPPFLNVHLGALTDFIVGSPRGNVKIGDGGNNLADELAAFSMLLSLLGLMFSAEKQEDEFIGRLRLNAMYWAMVVNILLFFVALFVFYDMDFFIVMVANIFSVPLLFLLRFHWTLLRMKSQSDEE